MATIEVKGKVVLRALNSVQPNHWNPNRMTDGMKASLMYGLEHDGWLASQALLVWGKDSTGKKRDLIIDGEHRWRCGMERKMAKAPMVFLDDLTEAHAKALTIKMDQKRGAFDPDALSELVDEIQYDLGDDLALDLGFEEDALMELLNPETKPPATPKNGGAGNGMPSSSGHVRQVQLFFTADQKAIWDAAIQNLAKRYGTESVTDTVMRAVESVVG